MPFLYNPITGEYTSSFMRDLNKMPGLGGQSFEKAREVISEFDKELRISKIPRTFFKIELQRLSDTRVNVRVKIQNPANPKEIAVFRIGYGFKKRSYWKKKSIEKDLNLHTDITGIFLHPNYGSSLWDKHINQEKFLALSEVRLAFKDFLIFAKSQFEKWNQLRTNNHERVLSEAPLVVSSQEMKLMLGKVSGFVLAHINNQRDSLIGTSKPPSEMRELLVEPIPQQGISLNNILQVLRKDVYPNNLDEGHPRFFDYVPAAPNPVSVLSHWISAGVNPFAGSWVEASGSTQLELQTIDWIRQLTGLPNKGGGLFLNGGSESNMHGVRVGRKILLGDDPLKTQNAVIYTSGQINSSAYKGLQTLGFNINDPNVFRELPVDSEFRLSVEALEKAIKEDKQNGRLPFCVIANFGTTGTGAIDPLSEISDICKRENLWLHVDAAYGGGFITSEKFRSNFDKIGINKADSLVINPHKAMFTTYGNSLLLVRDFGWLKETYQGKQKSPFLGDYKDLEVNFYECSPHFTRNDRQALELWMAIKYYGINEFGRAIDKLSHLAQFAADEINKDPKLKLVTGPNLSIVTFKYTFDGLSVGEQNKLNTSIREEVNKTGFANIGKTSLNDETVLRMCMINPQTTEDDIRKTLELVKKTGDKIIAASP